MKVLVIGSGAREHALCWKLRQSKHVTELFAAPGSDGMSKFAKAVPIGVNEIDKLITFARENKIDLTVVGPEDPLCAGIVDRFKKKGLRIYGPSESASRLEGSKAFAKDVMRRHAIPTGGFKLYEKAQPALEYLKNCDYPVVIKADGLAAGKGVAICEDYEQAEVAINEAMTKKRFGDAGKRVLIEDFLQGEEISVHAITDGRTILPLCIAQDHKRVGDADTGENTGGMGTYSPLPQIDDALMDQIQDEIIVRSVHAMNRDEVPFKGTMFIGVMLTKQGPRVLEYNVRFGDPETQTILARLRGDLYEILSATVDGKLDEVEVDWDPHTAVTVVCASGGYPRDYAKGYRIEGLDQDFGRDVMVFHAGTKKDKGEWFTNGGRVLSVTALGTDLADARAKAYAAIDKIKFDKMIYRKDIGWRGMK
ncbi:phosphoribosylamine---glycine ligase [Planctomycetaceae bacterium]|nr:phosphoribosylamine---glycine ligase [Planctomycetaceae bacterium]